MGKKKLKIGLTQGEKKKSKRSGRGGGGKCEIREEEKKSCVGGKNKN